MSERRPQYGEFATPEEQRARIQEPGIGWELDPPPAAGARLAEKAPVLDADTAPRSPSRAVGSPLEGDPSDAPTRGNPVDRIVTYALLAWGFINLFFTAPGLFDFPTTADRTYDIMGIPGDFANLAQGQFWGGIAGLVLIGGYALTAWLSWRRLRTGKRTWWLPLVGAVLTQVVVTALIAVPIMSDPVFQEYVLTTAGG